MEDLLLIVDLPEWPAASLLLQLLVSLLLATISDQQKNEMTQQLQLIAVRLVGNIASTIKAKMLKSEQQNIFNAPKVTLSTTFLLVFILTLFSLLAGTSYQF